jgi:putative DNA primase/helicase
VNAADLTVQLPGGATPSADGVWWNGQCPSHDDQRASLSFKNGHTSVVVRCHAGCRLEAILAALELRPEDLRLSNGNGHGPELSRIVAEYDYTDEQGARLYEVVRFTPKAFRQRRPDGQDGWIWNLTACA